jgi:hypothetical protein
MFEQAERHALTSPIEMAIFVYDDEDEDEDEEEEEDE